MTPRLTTASGAALAATVSIALITGCAPDKPASDAASAAGGGGFPATVENCGRTVTIDKRPEKIVAFDGAAETLFALGAGKQIAGYFGAAPDALPADLAAGAKQTKHLGGTFPFPAAEAVLEAEPDLIVAYGLNDEGGALQKRLDTMGIPYLNLSEACQDKADGTIDGYLGDVRTIGTAIGDPAGGEQLAGKWQKSIDALPQPAGGKKPSAVVNGNQDPSKPFVSGGGSFANDLLTRAGLANAYADESKAFASPSWEDVAERNPDVLFSAGGGGDEARDALLKHLQSNPALAQMTAAKTDGRVVTLDYARNVPGPQAIDGMKQMSEIAQQISEGAGQDG